MGLLHLSSWLPASWPAWAIKSFGGLLAGCCLVHTARRWLTMEGRGHAFTQNGQTATRHRLFATFQREYLLVYMVVMFADWLQGTHMYTLYSGYGMPVSTLFLTGFSSSLVFGTFVGLLVDRYGRRAACVLFCVLEIAINALEHVPNMAVLLLGRCLGGISTSLLFSAFESWMVSEHRRRGFEEEWLAETFSLAAAGNGIVAVVAGFAAQVCADIQGDIGPFRLAIALTVVALLLVARWPENYGGSSDDAAGFAVVAQSFRKAGCVIASDSRIALLACVSALFEGATFTFVFMWVPTLMAKYSHDSLPTGLVFASFMVCIATGGELFGLLVSDPKAILLKGSVEIFSFMVLVVAAASMLAPALNSSSFNATLGACCVLEICVGAFGGCAATMRSKYIPDAVQSAVMNISRVPLNILVVSGTTLAAVAPPHITFPIISATFALGAVLQLSLIRNASMPGKKYD